MNWKPNDLLRLIALVGGFLMCVLGAVLMWLGVGAEGSVDIKSTLLSGSVKSGSAGLFLIFFGSAIVLSVLLTLRSTTAVVNAEPRSKAAGLGKAFFALIGSMIFGATMGGLGFGDGFGLLAVGSGFLALAVGAAYFELSE